MVKMEVNTFSFDFLLIVDAGQEDLDPLLIVDAGQEDRLVVGIRSLILHQVLMARSQMPDVLESRYKYPHSLVEVERAIYWDHPL